MEIIEFFMFVVGNCAMSFLVVLVTKCKDRENQKRQKKEQKMRVLWKSQASDKVP